MLVILGVALGRADARQLRDEQENVLLVLAPVAVWLTLFLTTMLPFDFRGDIDRLALLKTLPLPPWRLAIGQLLAPVLLMTALAVGWFGRRGLDLAAERLAFARVLGLCRLRPADQLPAFRPG